MSVANDHWLVSVRLFFLLRFYLFLAEKNGDLPWLEGQTDKVVHKSKYNEWLEMMLRFKVPKKSAEVGDNKPKHI